MKKVTLDGRCFKNRKAGHQYMMEQFEFPGYYGKNLDALWDMLSTVDDLEIVITHEEEMVRHLGKYAKKIMDVFEDLEAHNSAVKIVRE